MHLEVDCSTGTTTNTPLTNDEWAVQKAAMTQAVEDEKARIAADEQFRAAIAAHPDPAFRELAQRLGVAP